MQASISNTPDGYVVSARFQMQGEKEERWHKVKNFGDRQGDAIVFRDIDLATLDFNRVALMAKKYNGRKFKRIKKGRYEPQDLYEE